MTKRDRAAAANVLVAVELKGSMPLGYRGSEGSVAVGQKAWSGHMAQVALVEVAPKEGLREVDTAVAVYDVDSWGVVAHSMAAGRTEIGWLPRDLVIDCTLAEGGVSRESMVKAVGFVAVGTQDSAEAERWMEAQPKEES